MDLFKGEIVAYSIADKQDNEFVVDSLDQLPAPSGTILHSDQAASIPLWSIKKL